MVRGWLTAWRGVFVRAAEVAFSEEAALLRRTCIDVLTRAKPQGRLYKATEGIVDTIDRLAEVVTGVGAASISGTRPHPVLIYHRRGSEPSSSALSLEIEEAPMHTPIPTPDLAAFLVLMGLLAVIATLANA